MVVEILKSLFIVVGKVNGADTVENSTMFLKKSNIELSYNPLLGIYLKKLKVEIWIDVHTPMFMATRFLCSQNMEGIQVSINGSMNGQNVVYTCNGLLFSITREWNSGTCYSMGKPRRHYTKWNKTSH